MKKLLATTAMCLVFASGVNSLASANELTANTVKAVQTNFDQHVRQNVLMVEQNLYRGDFQFIARSAKNLNLHTGMGAIKMVSIIELRF